MAVGLWVRAGTGEMGRRSGPGVGGRQIVVGGLEGEWRDKVEQGEEGQVGANEFEQELYGLKEVSTLGLNLSSWLMLEGSW